jgi:hypothetical protein
MNRLLAIVNLMAIEHVLWKKGGVLLICFLFASCKHLDADATRSLDMLEALRIALPVINKRQMFQSNRYEITIRQSSRGGWNVIASGLPRSPGFEVMVWVAENRRTTIFNPP